MLMGLLACMASTEPVLLAASSLTEPVTEVALAWPEPMNTRFGGSQSLRTQVEHGLLYSGFFSADQEHAKAVCSNPWPLVTAPVVLVVPDANPAGIEAFEDLPKAKRLVVGDGGVPAGRYADAVLERAGESLGPDFEEQVRAAVVSRESNVRLVRAKVLLGEADAAFVYATDVVDGLRAVALPASVQVDATWYGCSGPEVRERMESAPVQAVFRKHGFSSP
mgnify:CR=1 FL=1